MKMYQSWDVSQKPGCCVDGCDDCFKVLKSELFVDVEVDGSVERIGLDYRTMEFYCSLGDRMTFKQLFDSVGPDATLKMINAMSRQEPDIGTIALSTDEREG